MSVIEKMAQAMDREFGGSYDCTNLAQAAYNAMMQHLAETGLVIVPEEPTQEMEDAGDEAHGGAWDANPYAIYRAMIAAAKDQA